jgi:hypothetical protein
VVGEWTHALAAASGQQQRGNVQIRISRHGYMQGCSVLKLLFVTHKRCLNGPLGPARANARYI